MKNTGVIRKIDNLGRIVVPKEIRKNLNIHNGDDVQIFIEGDKIVLKKYQKVLTIKENAGRYLSKISKFCSGTICVIDKEIIVASSSQDYIDKRVDNKILNKIEERKQDSGHTILIDNEEILKFYYMEPIIVDADAIGGVIIVSEREISDRDKAIVSVLNMILCMEFY